jgi:3(or 17)beta-hydroxysteroid dehydrogenase
MRRLNERNALVTGGASGLGKAIAQRLAQEGAKVVISDAQADLGERTARECGVAFMHLDVCDEARWEEVVREIETRLGSLDLLINNAGIVGSTDACTPENTSLADWRKVFAVNADGVFLGCRTGVAAMRRTGGGAIVNVSSVAGMLATPYATAYGASKAAVRQLTKSVAQHCAQERLNIRCNCVHPGTVRTALWERHARETARARDVPIEQVVAEGKAFIPMGEFAVPEDIAAMVAFLASEEAGHITGAEFVIDGGVTGCDTYLMRSQALHRAGLQVDKP